MSPQPTMSTRGLAAEGAATPLLMVCIACVSNVLAGGALLTRAMCEHVCVCLSVYMRVFVCTTSLALSLMREIVCVPKERGSSGWPRFMIAKKLCVFV